MNPKSMLRCLWLALLLVASPAAWAEDIDLFAGADNSGLPNLIIILDNTGNWGSSFPAPGTPINCGNSNQRTSRYCAAKTALYNAINSITTTTGAKINVGLMLFNYNNGKANTGVAPTNIATGGHDGSYVRYAVRPLNAANKTTLLSAIFGLDKSGDQGVGNAQNAMSMEEARRYFAGLPVMNGNNTFFSSANGPQVLDLAATDSTHTTYVSPVTNACSSNFILYISNGPPASADDSAAVGPITAFNGGTTPTVLPFPSSVSSSWQSNWMDEYARLLYQNDDVASLPGTQNIVTYTISIRDPSNNNDNQNSAISARYLVKNAALQSGGKYFDTTSNATLQDALARVMAEIQAVNSVFVSATLPVALNISNTYLNQVYMGVFRPDAHVSPRWYGNLKEYKLAYDSGNQGITLVDRQNNEVVSAKTGFVVPTAWSRWTENPTTGSQSGAGWVDFWTNSTRGSPIPSATDAPDGEVVEKGGAAQKLREQYLTNAAIAGAAGSSDRKVLTCALSSACVATCSSTLAKFDLATVTASNAACQTTFGAASSTELSSLVNWIRGIDNTGTESGPGVTSTGATATIRGSVHGDVLHSRPQIVDYGASAGIVAYYGSNDGMLHAVCAGVSSDTCGSKQAGEEMWSFVAPDNFGKYKRLRDEVPIIWMPNLDLSAVAQQPQRRDYFFDGGIGVYHGASKTVIYVAGRRGGSFLYALDVTDPNNPSLVWKIDSTTSGFSHLAQSWSAPQVGYVRAKGLSNPVLFFGAGYCGGYSGFSNGVPIGVGEDSTTAATQSPTCPTSADGRGVYVVDLGSNASSTTPSVLKFFSATYNNATSIGDSVAADVALLDRDGDGYVDRVYAADIGGTVWRMDVDDASVNNWKLFKFAVAKQIADGFGQREKFIFRPDVVPTLKFDAVLVGSGNREDPLSTTTNNRFYMFKDFKTGKDASITPAMSVISDYTKLINAATATSDQMSAAISDTSNFGWYYPLLTDGEKVVNAPLTIAGTVFFATNRPNASLPSDQACSNLGEARAYRLNYATGAAPPGLTPSTFFTGGGLPPSATAGVVQINSSLVPFCIGCGPGVNVPLGTPVGGSSPIDPIKIFVNPPTTRKKTFWYSNTDQ